MNRVITDDLLDQLHRTISMVRDTIEQFDDDQWRSGIAWFHTPAREAYHLVESLDVYFGAERAGQDFVYGSRFGGKWWEMKDEELPTQAALLEYLGEVQARMEAEFASLDDDKLAAAFDLFEWSGNTKLGHYVYAMRHTLHHQGALTVLATHHGLEKDTWR